MVAFFPICFSRLNFVPLVVVFGGDQCQLYEETLKNVSRGARVFVNPSEFAELPKQYWFLLYSSKIRSALIVNFPC